MKRLLLPLLLAISLSPVAFAQSSAKIETVTVSAKGSDVRGILSDLFGQAKKNFVIEPNIHFALYLSLSDMEFEEALDLICKTASLKYELQNGIYFVSLEKHTTVVAGATATRPVGKLDPTLLRKKVNVQAAKQDLRALFSDLSKQSGVDLETTKTPAYKVDVVMKAVTLKYALETICRAAGLTYRFTDHQSIEILPKAEENQVAIHVDKG